MKQYLLLLLLSALFINLLAGDTYAEYKMTRGENQISISKIYLKDGNRRTETNLHTGTKEYTTTTLNLTSNPDVSLVFNSLSKTYTEVKKESPKTDTNNYTLTVIGNEKIGTYNCEHVRMTSNNNSWDMWLTKDIANFDFSPNNDAVTSKMKTLMKSKSIEGFPVKMAFLKPGTTIVTMTMELIKYESTTLADSLFTIPEGYTKNTVTLDPEKMKTMGDKEKLELIKKMMEQNMPKPTE